MTKIVRYGGNLKAFASEQQGSERTLFGKTTQANDITSQITPEFLRGWGNVGPSDEPSLQDFNAAFYTNGQILAYLHQAGVAEWHVAQEYFSGSVTQYAGTIYVSLIANNIGNQPDTNPTAWRSNAANGRLLRTLVFTRDSSGNQLVSINGATPTSTGALNFSSLPQTNFVKVKCQGAGGGSSGTWTCNSSQLSAGGGGGGGAYAEAIYAGSFTGLAVSVGIGGAGAPANSSTTSSTGGTSAFGAMLSCPGGGGSANNSSASSQAGVSGGSGESQAPTGSGIIVSVRGGSGFYGLQFAGLSPAGIGGNGGQSQFGAGKAPAGAVLSPGSAAVNWGTGAAGAFTPPSSAGQPGAKGADGVVIIEEYS